MPLQLYKRRHSNECLAEIERRVAAGEIQQPDLEQYRHCACAWWVRGTTDEGNVIPRHSLKAHTWEAACAAMKELNQWRIPDQEIPKSRLELYKRRHSPECLRGIKRLIEAKKIKSPDLEHYHACACPWWIRGTTDDGRHIPRRSLKVYSWDAACAALRKINQQGSTQKHTLIDAKEEWLTEVRVIRKRTVTTLTTYARVADKLIDFVGNKGIHLVADVTPVHINLLCAAWDEAGTALSSCRNQLTNLSTFFKFCVRMEYVRTNPFDRVLRPQAPKPEPGSEDEFDDANATLPYDLEGDANWRKIRSLLIPYLRNEIVRPGRERQRARRGELTSKPESFLALVELMYETGLRISDAIHFKPAKLRINGNGQGLYTTRQVKTGNHVTVLLEPWLVEKIQALPLLGGSPYYPFFDGRKDWKGFISNNVSNVLREFGEAIGIPEVRCHRFRDSFAINQLNMGIPITMLKDLLGHKNVAMTERYYAPFVKSRGDSTMEQAERIRQAHRAGKVISIHTKLA